MRAHLLSAIFALAVVGVLPADLSAQDDGDAHEQMLAVSDEGYAAFSEGRFREAAQKFARAYELQADATLLKNEAIAWLKAGEPDAAIDAAARFLIRDDTEEADVVEVQRVWANAKLGLAREALDDGTLEVAEALIAEVEGTDPDKVVAERLGILRIDLAKAQKAERERREAAQREERELAARERELAMQRDIEANRAAEAKARAAEAKAEAARERERRERRQTSTVAGIALASGGGAVLIGTLVYHLTALGWENRFYEIAENGGDADTFEQLRGRLTTARVALPVLYTIGAAATGAGVWFIVRPVRASESPGRTAVHVGIGFGWELP